MVSTGEGVSIALQGREPDGIVAPEDYDTLDGCAYTLDLSTSDVKLPPPPPGTLSVTAAVGWGVLTLLVGNLATLVPARQASKLVIRESLVHT